MMRRRMKVVTTLEDAAILLVGAFKWRLPRFWTFASSKKRIWAIKKGIPLGKGVGLGNQLQVFLTRPREVCMTSLPKCGVSAIDISDRSGSFDRLSKAAFTPMIKEGGIGIQT